MAGSDPVPDATGHARQRTDRPVTGRSAPGARESGPGGTAVSARRFAPVPVSAIIRALPTATASARAEEPPAGVLSTVS